MKVLEPWHKYELEHLDWEWKTILQFVDRNHWTDKEWINNQELIRVLIDRITFLDNEIHWELNQTMITYLKKIILLHEMRALERKYEKWQIKIENIITWKDGHFKIKEK